MSWSINIQGPKEIIVRELADALLLLDQSLNYAQKSDAPQLTVNLSGQVGWREGDEVASSTVTFNFGETYPGPPPVTKESYPLCPTLGPRKGE